MTPELDFTPPVLPYAGTSGWSGSETSKQRAINEDKSGVTNLRQKQTIVHLNHNESRGLTWRDLSEITNWHHGTASGVLSVLHKAGIIIRLKETRNRCAIYVTPEWRQGREIVIRKTKNCKHCGGEL